MRRPLRGRSGGAVFLAYHSVTEDGPPYLSLTPASFERQLEALRRYGFAAGRRSDLARLARGERLPGKRVFLTFDDGFRDTVEVALPRMAEHGFAGFAFILPGHLETGAALAWPEVAGEARRRPQLMRSLDWGMAEQLIEAGWEIGSHTLSHARLTELGDEQLREELLDSRRLVSERLGRCELLAYPFGAWDERVAAAAADAGYAFAFTLPFGQQLRAGPLSIPRVTVDERDLGWRFRLKLSRAGRAALFSPLRPLARSVLRRRPHSHAE